MNISIIKHNKFYNVVVDEVELQMDLVYKTYPIYFKIDQSNLDLFIQTILKYKNGNIKESDLINLQKDLESFILLQNNLFLLNNKALDEKIDKKIDIILSFIQTSKNILVPSPKNISVSDIKTKFKAFLENNIQITNDKTNVLTSLEIKTPFLLKENIEKDWKNFIFKEINIELNNVLKEWSENHSLETKTINKKMPTKFYYGVMLTEI